MRNPDLPFLFQRRTVDLTAWIPTGAAAVTVAQPPGSAASAFVAFGVPAAEATVAGLPQTYAVPFQLIINLATLANSADILGFWHEYSIRSVRFEVQTLMGDSVSLNSAGSGSSLPEVLTAAHPVSAGTSFDPETVMAFADTQRSVLTLERPHRARFQPVVPIGLAGVSGTVMESNHNQWYPFDITQYGLIGAIRNWQSQAMVSAQPVPIRFSATYMIAARRPR
jgi:hypothetical protein